MTHPALQTPQFSKEAKVMVLFGWKLFRGFWCCCSFNFTCISNIPHLYFPLLRIAGFDGMFLCGSFPTFTLCLLPLVSFPFHNFLDSSCGLFFPASRDSFRICCKAGLVVLNSLSFCLSGKLDFSVRSEGEHYWTEYSWLQVSSFFGCRISFWQVPLFFCWWMPSS